MATIKSGTLAIGVRDVLDMHAGAFGPGETHERIAYRITQDDNLIRERDGWKHYTYRFHYTYTKDGQSRSFSITWRCGTAYGEPKGTDGLTSALLDAMYARDAFEDMSASTRRACEQTDARLDVFFGSEGVRTIWADALESYM